MASTFVTGTKPGIFSRFMAYVWMAVVLLCFLLSCAGLHQCSAAGRGHEGMAKCRATGDQGEQLASAHRIYTWQRDRDTHLHNSSHK